MKNSLWVKVRRLCLCLLSVWLAAGGLSCAPARALGPQPGGGPPSLPVAPAEPPPELVLSQSIPQGLALADPELPGAAQVWQALFHGARSHIEIAQFYVQSEPGEAMAPILDELLAAARRGVRVRVLLSSTMKDSDAPSQERLKAAPGVEVRYLNLSRTGGVLHAKYLLVDDELLYVGSQNFDWRSLTQIHELGVRVRSRPLAGQLGSIFALDWALAAAPAAEPPSAPAAPSAPGEPALPTIASAPPLPEATPATPVAPPEVELVASPPSLLPHGTRPAIEALVELLRGARRSVHVQLLKYTPYPFRSHTVWPVIDAELRAAAARGVKVRLLVSDWVLGGRALPHLKALALIPNLEVKVASIPEAKEGHIPFARVIHSKYLVADEVHLALGTSNWEESYFTESRNIELLFRDSPLATQAARIHDRLWTSRYAFALDPARTYEKRKVD